MQRRLKKLKTIKTLVAAVWQRSNGGLFGELMSLRLCVDV